MKLKRAMHDDDDDEEEEEEMERLLPFPFYIREWEKKTGIKIEDKVREGRYKLRDLIELLEFMRVKAGFDDTMKKRLKKEVLEIEIQRSESDNSKGN